MSYNDTLSDSLTRIKNAQRAKHEFAILRHSTFVVDVLKVLEREGYISSFELAVQDNGVKLIKVDLKYHMDAPVISDITRVSTPGRRKYVSLNHLPKAKNGLAIVILSTSKGVVSDFEARNLKVGGEMLCVVN